MKKIIDNEIEHAVALLTRGELVAFPTETVYGLGADANNPAAVAKIFSAKKRPANHPLIVHLANVEQLSQWAETVPENARLLAKHFWPGPLTLILPKAKQVSMNLTGGQTSIGLRVPKHPVAQALLQAFGRGIAAPSANRFGKISPTTAKHVQEELGEAVSLVLDGGACNVGIESTILDVTTETVKVLRPGIISAEQISAVLAQPLGNNTNSTLRVSGHLASHYAPSTKTQLVATENLTDIIKENLVIEKKIYVIARQKQLVEHENLIWLTMSDNPQIYAHDLYAKLRQADNASVDLIVIEAVPDNKEWLAINDRLQKAAFPK